MNGSYSAARQRDHAASTPELGNPDAARSWGLFGDCFADVSGFSFGMRSIIDGGSHPGI